MILDRLLIKNISVLTIAQIVSMIAGLGTMAILARALGPEAFGILGFGVAMLSFFGILVSLGTDTYGAREIARQRGDAAKIAGSVIGFRACAGIVSLVIFAGVVFFLDRTPLERQVLLIQGGGLLVIAFTLDFIFQGLERIEINGARQVIAALTTLVAVWLFIETPDDVAVAAWSVLGAGLFSVAIAGAYLNTKIAYRSMSWSPRLWKIVLKASLPLAVAGAMYTIMFTTDTVMLGLMRSNEEVGLYTAAFRVLLIGIVPLGLLSTPFFPRLSAAFGDAVEMLSVSRAYSMASLFVGMPIVVGGILFADEIIAVIYGAGFVAAAPVLQILMFAVLLLYVRSIYGPALAAWDGDRPLMIISSIGAVLNVVLNLFLIPRYGIEGAAGASVISHAAVGAGFAWSFRRRLKTSHSMLVLRSGLIVLVAAAITVLIMRQFGEAMGAPLTRLLIGGGIFGILYLVPALRFGWPFVVPGDKTEASTNDLSETEDTPT